MKSIKKKTLRVSRTRIVDIINSTKGRFFTVTFVKKDGTQRVMNCNKPNLPLTRLGYILVNDLQEKKDGKKWKSVDPRTITSLRFENRTYSVRD